MRRSAFSPSRTVGTGRHPHRPDGLEEPPIKFLVAFAIILIATSSRIRHRRAVTPRLGHHGPMPCKRPPPCSAHHRSRLFSGDLRSFLPSGGGRGPRYLPVHVHELRHHPHPRAPPARQRWKSKSITLMKLFDALAAALALTQLIATFGMPGRTSSSICSLTDPASAPKGGRRHGHSADYIMGSALSPPFSLRLSPLALLLRSFITPDGAGLDAIRLSCPTTATNTSTSRR